MYRYMEHDKEHDIEHVPWYGKTNQESSKPATRDGKAMKTHFSLGKKIYVFRSFL